METVVSLYGVQPLRIGGVETLLREITRQLKARGVRHAVAFSGPPAPKVAKYLDEAGLIYTVDPRLTSGGWAQLRAVDELLVKYRPTTLHYNFMTLLGPVPWLARLRGVSRVFYTDHTSRASAEVTPTPAWKRVIARGLQIPLTGVVCVSKQNHRMGVERGVFPADRSFVLYNASELPSLEGTEESGPAFRRRFNIPAEALVVTSLCWMIPEKGIGDLIDAAPLVRQRIPEAHFVIGGIGPSLEAFKAQARSLPLDGHITFTGLIENPLQDGIFPACDVFCQPSRWQEAFGWVISEAMGFQRAVVASEVGGIPEVVEAGVTGLLCPPGEPAVLAERLIELLSDPPRREAMGRAGRRRAEENFEMVGHVEKLLQRYGY